MKKEQNIKLMIIAAIIFAILTIVNFSNGNTLVGCLFLIAAVCDIISALLLKKQGK